MPEYTPLYSWRITWPDPSDADSHKTDFCGWDGEIWVGRIRLEAAGPKKGQWQWSGGGPYHGLKRRLLPQQGFVDTAREASRMAEDYYHALMRYNGLRGSKDEH